MIFQLLNKFESYQKKKYNGKILFITTLVRKLGQGAFYRKPVFTGLPGKFSGQ